MKPTSRPTPRAARASASRKVPKAINLAIQGGGAHCAFAWGVMDRFLQDQRIEVDAISGTSAGSMNAVVYAYGKIKGAEAARQALHDFWHAVSEAGRKFNPVRRMPWEAFFPDWHQSLAAEAFRLITSRFSPYQLNPGNFNPLRDVLEAHVDFDELARSSTTKLFLAATNVRTGKPRVFHTHEVTVDAVLASACLPEIFHAVEIGGEYYWDGGYVGNPVLYPLFYYTETKDVVILHINPIERPTVPTRSHEIMNRVNEISFNSSLLRELRAVYFVQKLLEEGWIKDEFRDKLKHVRIHSVRADQALADLSVASKFSSEWEFLTMLRDRGRNCAEAWLARHFDDLGVRCSVDLKDEFL